MPTIIPSGRTALPDEIRVQRWAGRPYGITKILAAKRANPQVDTSTLEGEIDHAKRVAPRQLYGLSEDEVKIVEGKT